MAHENIPPNGANAAIGPALALISIPTLSAKIIDKLVATASRPGCFRAYIA
jgi:hypothetical protein